MNESTNGSYTCRTGATPTYTIMNMAALQFIRVHCLHYILRSTHVIFLLYALGYRKGQGIVLQWMAAQKVTSNVRKWFSIRKFRIPDVA